VAELDSESAFCPRIETSPELARRAHRRPGPSTSFPHPTAKAMPLANVTVPTKPVFVTETDPVSPEAALAQLRVIGRNRWPSLSEAESFLRVVTDPEYQGLVTVALRTPTGSTPPRQ